MSFFIILKHSSSNCVVEARKSKSIRFICYEFRLKIWVYNQSILVMLSPFHDNKFRTFGFSYKRVPLFYFISFDDDEIPLLGIVVKIPGTYKFRTFGFCYKWVSLFYFISSDDDDEILMLDIVVKIPRINPKDKEFGTLILRIQNNSQSYYQYS